MTIIIHAFIYLIAYSISSYVIKYMYIYKMSIIKTIESAFSACELYLDG